MKRVSVIIPAYNKADYTVRTVQSILDQTWQSIEILVIDDGSKDDTQEKMEAFGDSIRYFRKQNGGACAARNFGIRQAKGDYLAFIDCDDVYYPEKITKSVALLDENPDYGFVHTNIHFIDADEKIISKTPSTKINCNGWISDRMLNTNLVFNSTVVVRRECLEKVGNFDESVFIPADWDLWLRLSEQYQVGYIDEPLTGYRKADNYTIANIEESLDEEIQVLKKAFARRKTPNFSTHIYLSNTYYRTGLLYGAVKDLSNSRNMFFKAIKEWPLNWKSLCFFTALCFAPHFTHKKINSLLNSL